MGWLDDLGSYEMLVVHMTATGPDGRVWKKDDVYPAENWKAVGQYILGAMVSSLVDRVGVYGTWECRTEVRPSWYFPTGATTYPSPT